MHAPKMACSIVALVILFASLASFAVCKKGLVRRRVDGHPDLACFSVDTVGMTSQLMFTPEAVGIVGAGGALEPQHSTGRRL